MGKLVQTLGITGLSKSQVWLMAQDLDEHVREFRSRRLAEGPYTFIAADAWVLKVREGGRVVKVSTGETSSSWLVFFRDLVAPGLTVSPR